MNSSQVVVDSLLVRYEAVGKGKTVVLLHGWGDSSASFKQLQAVLAKHYRAVALDLPGFGGTQLPTKPWGLEDYALFVAHFLQKIEAGPVFALVGHSNGGALAVHGLASGTLKAERLILLAAAGIRATDGLRKTAFKLVAKGGKAATFWLPAASRQKLRGKLYGAAGSDMLVVPELQETFKKTVAQDVQADAARLILPTLMLYGQQDTATPPWFGRRFHELMSNSTLEILPTAGHFVHLDAPQQVAAAIEDFLK